MAPFAPFFSEHVYRQLRVFVYDKNELPHSVHLCDYPKAAEQHQDEQLEQTVDLLQRLVVMGRRKRNELKIPLKTPLQLGTVLHSDANALENLKELAPYLTSELNFKQLTFSQDEAGYIDLFVKPNFPKLGKRLGKNMKALVKQLASLNAEDIETLQKRGYFEFGEQRIDMDDLEVFRQAKPGVNVVSDRFISLSFNTELTEELVGEGKVREIVGYIQKQRKAQGLGVTDKIRLTLGCSDQIQHWIHQHRDTLMNETLCKQLNFGDDLEQGPTYKLNDEKIVIGIQPL